MSQIAQRHQQQQDVQQKKPTLVQIVQRMQPEIARALPKGMDADRVARLALTVIRQSEMAKAKGTSKHSLADCSADSFAGALLTAAALGLEPGVNGEAYLVPHGRECTLIIGYQGMVKLFWQHPMARHIDAQPVYEQDEFSYAYGLEPYLIHKPALGDRGQVSHYYAVASLTTGAKVFLVATADEVKKLRSGKVGSNGGIPDPMRWMERKTMLRQLVKMLPKSTQMLNAVAVDERTGTDLAVEKVPEQLTTPGAPAIEPPSAPAEKVDTATGEVLDVQELPEGYDPSQEPEGWRS
ncbi:hypothetical protein DT076_16800 [Desertihabitans brevis]|uniref:Recombinase RecT n=1 Tax=Desertihabitans brevis TaxID=2268447 RepID=A0A367YQZ0_9ACTN|nr:recombinase RecT [Desertihabitans brevis]RCK68305.1 hypothetical protein DT076_16800 [Desertihabitans brevis]